MEFVPGQVEMITLVLPHLKDDREMADMGTHVTQRSTFCGWKTDSTVQCVALPRKDGDVAREVPNHVTCGQPLALS